jgi:cellulose synthase/poly-beta-1,6-N-acetylglucosamine synthase-like glycosyltransferase
MINLNGIEWLFAILVLIIFTNRYLFGSILRMMDKRTKDGFSQEPDVWPSVTIVTPVFNEGSTVIQTADSFAKLDYPKDKLNVIFVDDVSTDDTYEHLLTAQKNHPWMQVTRNPHNMGKRLGIKRAVLKVHTDLIMSVDSDVIVERNAMRNMVKHMHTTGVDAVGGCVFVSNADENWLTRMQAVKYWVGYMFLKNIENTFDHVMCLSGCLTIYKREALIAVDEDVADRRFLGDEVKYGEDRFLTRKLVEKGYKTRLTFDAQCYTKAPATMANYISQQLRWRRSNMIDLITAIPHINKFNTYVAIHYIAMGMLLLFYPMVLFVEFMRLGFIIPMMLHALLAACFGIAYELNKHKVPEMARTDGIWFMAMALIFPVVYLTLNPLALATLGTTSWETRGAKKKKAQKAKVTAAK